MGMNKLQPGHQSKSLKWEGGGGINPERWKLDCQYMLLEILVL